MAYSYPDTLRGSTDRQVHYRRFDFAGLFSLLMMRRYWFVWAVLLCLTEQAALAQPTVAWERMYAPARYRVAQRSFALPGRRYLHSGAVLIRLPNSQYRAELAWCITTATGDTVRAFQLNRNGVGSRDLFSDAVLEPDQSVTVFGLHHEPSGPGGQQQYFFFLTQVDTLGQVRWHRQYPADTINGTSRMVRVADGYLLCVNSQAFGGSSFPIAGLVKTDLQGTIQWRRRYPSRGYGAVGAFYGLTPCRDGSYLAVGYTDNGLPYSGGSTYFRANYWLAKLRPNGDTLRTRQIGLLPDAEFGQQVMQTRDGGFACVGKFQPVSPSLSSDRGQLFKVDSLLTLQWRQIAVPVKLNSFFQFLQETTSGNLIVGGVNSYANDWTADFMLRSYAANGTLQWERHTNLSYQSVLSTMVSEADGSAMLAGYVESPNSTYQAYYARYANVGALAPSRLCQTPPQATFAFYTPAPDSLVALDISAPGPPFAELALWRWDFGDGTALRTAPGLVRHRYAAPPAAGTPVTLTVTNNLGCTHAVTLYPFGAPTAAQAAQQLSRQLQVFPNPAGSGPVMVRLPGAGGAAPAQLQLLDALGRVVRQQPAPVTGGVAEARLAVGGLPAGVYLVRLRTAAGTASQRLVLP